MRVRAPITLICLACWPLLGHPAAVEPIEGLQLNANVGFMRDNNLFRLHDSVPVPNPLLNIQDKSDTLFTYGAGLKYDKMLSRQRVLVDLNVNENKFDKNSDLDYTGYDGRLAWFWRVGNDWDGEASYRKRRTLGGFADVVQKLQDLVESDYYRFTAGYQLDVRWRVSAEIGKEEHEHSAVNQRTLDVDAKTAGMGVMYRTKADNSIGVQARRTDRDYPNRGIVTPSNNHTEDRINAVAQWRLTGLLRLDAQAGYVDVSHDEDPSRDFSGFSWRAAGTWDATGKFRLTVTGFREVRLYEDVNTNYIVANGINVTPVYAITSKVTMQGDFIYEKRDFRPNTQREDDFRLFRLGLVYQPLRNVDLSLSWETGERKSNFFFNSYDYQAWFGTARISFW